LLTPLAGMCTVDETTVRQQAVDSITQLCKQLSSQQIHKHLAPHVLQLLSSADWFPPRVSACGLIASAYKGCLKEATSGNDDAKQKCKELLEGFKKMCEDPEPMVKRTAAAKVGEVAKEFPGKDLTDEHKDILAAYVSLLGNESESIRCNALKSSAEVFRHVYLEKPPVKGAPATTTLSAGQSYTTCRDDKSWRVRVALAQSLSDVTHTCKSARNGAEAEVSVAQDLFTELMADNESEVRNASAAQAAAAASVLGAEFAIEHLVPRLTNLVMDDQQSDVQRTQLAGVLLEMAGPIGATYARTVYLNAPDGSPGLVSRLLSAEESTNLRIAVISMLPALIDVVQIDAADELLELIHEQCGEKNWRVRHAALTLLTDLAPAMGVTKFDSSFMATNSHFVTCASDNCALIRLDFVTTMKRVGETYGGEWLIAQIMPAIRQLHTTSEKSNYQLSAVVLHAFTEFGALLAKFPDGLKELKGFFLPAALAMAEDMKNVNLRIIAAQSLSTVLKEGWLSDEPSVKAKLETLKEDSDPDVSSFAAIAD